MKGLALSAWLAALLSLAPCASQAASAPSRPHAAGQTSCFYDPHSPAPNPFGMRAYLTIAGDSHGAVATYDMLPSNESGDPKVQATLEERRTLKFYDLGLAAARRYLAANAAVYHDLIGDEHPVMPYPEFDKHLRCTP
jgi:hypothetical protein